MAFFVLCFDLQTEIKQHLVHEAASWQVEKVSWDE